MVKMSENLNVVGQQFLDGTHIVGQGEEMKMGGFIEGISIGTDIGEVVGVGSGHDFVMKKGETVVDMEVDDKIKNDSESGFVVMGGQRDIVDIGGGAGVGGNYDVVVPEMEVNRAEYNVDGVAMRTVNEVVEVVDDQVKSGTESGFVAVGGDNESFNAGGGGTGVTGNYDEVVHKMEVDRVENDAGDVAVGTVNKVFKFVDEMCSGGISVGRNEFDPMSFEHFNSEGLNLVVDLGDIFGSEKETRPGDGLNEDFKSDGITVSANSNMNCVDADMERVNLVVDLSGACKEYKDERLAVENDGTHVTVCGSLHEHFYKNVNFSEELHVTDGPLLVESMKGTDGNKMSDAKEIPVETCMGNRAVSGHHFIGANNNQNAGFEEHMTGVSSDDKDGYKFNVLALKPKVRSENDQTEKDGEYYLSDLVWGKVTGHPWWPGQIFEPSAASTKAEKHFKKGAYLVAYFGDRTFAWNEPESIKPFRSHFVRMEKLSKLEDFCEAVDCALKEVSRRVEYGLSCLCLPKDQLAKMENQTCINAGIRQKSIRRYGIGKGASTFVPTELLQNIELLAADPFHEIEKLRFVNVRAQLLAYNHWKGFNYLPDIVNINGLGDGDAVIKTMGKKSSVHMHDKGEGRTRRSTQGVSSLNYKHISYVSDDSSIMVDSETEMVRRRGRKKRSLPSSKKLKAIKPVSSDLMFSSQKASSHWDHKGCSSRLSKYVEVGDHVGNNSIDSRKLPLPEEILSKLYLAAASPMEGYEFVKSFISFLSYYRDSICLEHRNSGKRKRSIVEEIGKKYFKPEADTTNEIEGTEDLYWTDRIILSNPEKQELLGQDDHLGTTIPDVAGEVELGAENTSEVGENSQEYTPTELILKFTDLESIPSITELNNIFSRYGPLYESQTVIFSKSKRAKVVFKIRSHAETAFSSSGKFSIFGHSLLGYCLKARTSSARNKKVAKSASAK